MEEQTQEQTPEKKEQGFRLIEVPTQMGLAIETPEGDHITEAQLLVVLTNKITKLEKAIAG